MRSTVRLASKIVEWFQANQRDLPWRRTCEPYAIWVSEIMLQQTQVKTVIPYWERWIRELPTIRALAEAPIDRILKLWEGLGYYSRARNLQRGAQWIMDRHNGKFPADFEQILELPGVGRYTAGAISSIAFGKPAPIVDGNVIRVLARYFGILGDPKQKIVNATFWSAATQLVEATEDCSSLNQGLMELGAMICLPREPLCERCPIAKGCFARENNRIEFLPETVERPKTQGRIFRATLIRRKDEVFLRKRPAGVVNSGFWEMPNDEVKAAKKEGVLCAIKHTITRYRMTLEVVENTSFVSDGEWVSTARLSDLPLVNAHRKALQKLGVMASSKTEPDKNLMEHAQTCAMI